MTVRFAYLDAADGSGELAVNIERISMFKTSRRQKENTVIASTDREIEVVGTFTVVGKYVESADRQSASPNE